MTSSSPITSVAEDKGVGAFEQYACIPLDVPRPPVELREMREFVQQHCESCAFTDNVIRLVMYFARKPVVDGQQVLSVSDPRMEELQDSTHFEWDPQFRSHFPDLVRWVESLPFRRIDGFTLVTQTSDVADHLDCFGVNNSVTYYQRFRRIEPRYYRIVFCEPDDEACAGRSFFVTRTFGGARSFVRLPAGTSTIAMSSSTCYHGAVHQPGHFKTTGVLYGELDEPRHLQLLRHSLDAYSDYAIHYDEAGPVSGPGAEMPYRGAEGGHRPSKAATGPEVAGATQTTRIQLSDLVNVAPETPGAYTPLGLLPTAQERLPDVVLKRFEAIEAFDLEEVLSRAIATGVLESCDADAVELGLRRFLAIASLSEHDVLVPSRRVEELWQQFVLHTESYRRFCAEMAGRQIDYTPVGLPASAETWRRFDESYSRTKQELTDRFGVQPIWLWPSSWSPARR